MFQDEKGRTDVAEGAGRDDENNHCTKMCCGNEEGSDLKLVDSCITQLKAQGYSRTCNERKKEEEGKESTDVAEGAGGDDENFRCPDCCLLTGMEFRVHMFVRRQRFMIPCTGSEREGSESGASG